MPGRRRLAEGDARRGAGDYAKLASVVLGYAVLGLVWWAALQECWAVMAPRLWHVGPGGMRLVDWREGPLGDFSVFWPAGELARARRAAVAYDPAAFLAFRKEIFSGGVGMARWFYPPPAFLPVMAVATLPYELGYWIWLAAGNGLAVWLLRWGRLPWGVIAVGLLSPAALWNAQVGQFGVWEAGLLVAALLRLADAPGQAGLALGFLVMKPQLAVLAGVAMLARRDFCALAVAVGVAVALAAAVTGLAGWRVWPAYLGDGLAASRLVLETRPADGGIFECFGTSVFWAVRELGGGLGAAYGVQALAAAGAAAVVWHIWRVGWGGAVERMAVTVCLSLVVSPFGYTYDMVGYEVALAACAAKRGWRIDVLDALLFVAPAVCPVICAHTGWLLTPLAGAVAAARICWRGGLWRQDEFAAVGGVRDAGGGGEG